MYSPPESTLDDTELTLGLPGRPRRPNVPPRGNVLGADNESSESEVTSTRKSPASKAQAVGWPPLRAFRKKALGSRAYVKVAVDGAPYLRKVDLEEYRSYEELMRALEEMFDSFAIHCNSVDEDNLVPTYEDKEGDWMLVGDVPWGMFKESCKRIRLMKSSESLLDS